MFLALFGLHGSIVKNIWFKLFIVEAIKKKTVAE